ncbi:MAG: diphosphate--fructose-6-phosphate 1-phosphotransferase [Clostridia bacterium]|nr:diphosphate--fructose-6-phosphate 1-phosphotransferase [Clostridia bacterium]
MDKFNLNKNIMIGQSGGPTVAINASLAGIINAAALSGLKGKIYGLINGISGLMEDRFIDLSGFMTARNNLNKLTTSPAMFLGSCRYKLPKAEDNEEVYKTLFKKFDDMNIGAFFYIGGNDSMDTAAKLSAYAEKIGSDVCFIGVPKTVDNDLCEIDHTPGFGSAAKYIATTVKEIVYDTSIYRQDKVTIIEVMGRNAGWLTAAAALARTGDVPIPQFIYLPETVFDKDKFIKDIEEELTKHNNVVVCVSEGIKDHEGNYIAATGGKGDGFGHVQLAGAGKVLENLVKERLGIKCRAVEINISQRCAGHLCSKMDIDEAYDLGIFAYSLYRSGMTGVLSSMRRIPGDEYHTEYYAADVSKAANGEKKIPLEWIDIENADVKQEMIDYIKPLIQGEVPVNYVDGLPDYIDISHLIPAVNK